MDERFPILCLHNIYLYPIGQNVRPYGHASSQCGGETQQNGHKKCKSLGAITIFIYSASGFRNRREMPVISSHKAYSQWTNNGIKGNRVIVRRKWVMDSKIND